MKAQAHQLQKNNKITQQSSIAGFKCTCMQFTYTYNMLFIVLVHNMYIQR